MGGNVVVEAAEDQGSIESSNDVDDRDAGESPGEVTDGEGDVGDRHGTGQQDKEGTVGGAGDFTGLARGDRQETMENHPCPTEIGEGKTLLHEIFLGEPDDQKGATGEGCAEEEEPD